MQAQRVNRGYEGNETHRIRTLLSLRSTSVMASLLESDMVIGVTVTVEIEKETLREARSEELEGWLVHRRYVTRTVPLGCNTREKILSFTICHLDF